MSIQKLNNTLFNDQKVKEEIKRRVKNTLKQMKMNGVDALKVKVSS